jgi:tetratricopeptide (TPR) repeat protein
LLTGKVLQRGDSLNVQAELVDVKQDAQLWGERFVRRVSDILAVEDEIAGQIVDHLRLALTGEERERFARRYTEDTDAYRLYLKGLYHWSKRTGADLKKSAGYFEQAIAKDPAYALPYAGLADAYVVMAFFDAGVPAELLARGKAAALRALEIDPELSEAHASLGISRACLDNDWDSAEDAFRSALRRTPPYWLAYTHHAMILAARGRFDDAVAEVRRGQELEPLSLVAHHHVAWISLLARRPDDAIAESRSAIEMDPTFGMAHMWMGVALEQKGLYQEALAPLDQAIKCLGGNSISTAAAAHAYAMAGQTEEAQRRLAALKAARTECYVQPYAIALVHAGLGEIDEALSWLEQAHREHAGWWPLWAKGDSRLDPLRDHSRFQDLLRSLGVSE